MRSWTLGRLLSFRWMCMAKNIERPPSRLTWLGKICKSFRNVSMRSLIMHALIRRKSLLAVLPLFLAVVGFALPAFAQEASTYDDPFYKQKGTLDIIEDRHLSPFQQVNESVDPFTGNLNLLHTDVILPGNGGLNLKIQRAYNSRIWGRKDTSFPGLVALNERSVMGIGWSFHFGRMRNPWGTGSNNSFLPDNPIIEMPDGSQHPFYQDNHDFSRFISREQWIYKRSSSCFDNTTCGQVTLTDGTVYSFYVNYWYGTSDNVLIWQVAS